MSYKLGLYRSYLKQSNGQCKLIEYVRETTRPISLPGCVENTTSIYKLKQRYLDTIAVLSYNSGRVIGNRVKYVVVDELLTNKD